MGARIGNVSLSVLLHTSVYLDRAVSQRSCGYLHHAIDLCLNTIMASPDDPS
jgi:hypothetical protein